MVPVVLRRWPLVRANNITVSHAQAIEGRARAHNLNIKFNLSAGGILTWPFQIPIGSVRKTQSTDSQDSAGREKEGDD